MNQKLIKQSIYSAGLFLLMLVFAGNVSAQSVASEQRKLLTEQENLLKSQENLKALKGTLAKSEEKLQKITRDLQPLINANDAAKEEWRAAVADAAAQPGEEMEAKVKNARFKHVLAERKLQKASGKSDKLKASIAATRSEIAKHEAQIKASNSEIVQSKQKITELEKAEKLRAEQRARQSELVKRDKLRQQRELDLKRQQLAKTEQENLAAKAEIERLKSLLEQKKAAAAATAAVAPAAVARPAPVAPAPATPQKAGAVNDEVAKARSIEEGFRKKVGDRSPTGRGLVISVVTNNGVRSDSRRILLDRYSKGLYRKEVVLAAGETKFRVGRDFWDVVISEQDGGSIHIVMLDKSKSEAELFVYSKNKLQ